MAFSRVVCVGLACLVLLGTAVAAPISDEPEMDTVELVQEGGNRDISPKVMLQRLTKTLDTMRARLLADTKQHEADKLGVLALREQKKVAKDNGSKEYTNGQLKIDEEIDQNLRTVDTDKVAVMKAEANVKRTKEAYDDLVYDMKQGPPGCRDQKKYHKICSMKKQLCDDKEFGHAVSKQCPETCAKLPASCTQ